MCVKNHDFGFPNSNPREKPGVAIEATPRAKPGAALMSYTAIVASTSSWAEPVHLATCYLLLLQKQSYAEKDV